MSRTKDWYRERLNDILRIRISRGEIARMPADLLERLYQAVMLELKSDDQMGNTNKDCTTCIHHTQTPKRHICNYHKKNINPFWCTCSYYAVKK